MKLFSGFSNTQLEARFRSECNAAQLVGSGDAQFCLVLAGIWIFGSLYMALRSCAFSAGIQLAAWSAAVWLLLLWPLARFAPATYRRHRRLVVLAQRCACVLLPTVADLAARLAPDTQLPPSPGPILSVVILSSQVTTVWALALGLRLDLVDHLLPHAIFAADVTLRQAPALCSTPFISNPASLQGFSRLADSLTATVLLPPLALYSLPKSEGQDQEWTGAVVATHCQALVVVTHIVFGTVLSTFAVYVLERRSRAAFLHAAAAEAGGWSWQSAQHLGLPAGEFIEATLFDGLGAWARCLSLVPLLLAATWWALLALGGAWPAG